MKVYVITETRWSGDERVNTVYGVKSNEEAARNLCYSLNDMMPPISISCNYCDYDYIEFDVEEN